MPHLSIILVTWNCSHALSKCLPALPADAQVIVADNASRDAVAVEALCARYGAEFLPMGENIGFAAANNRAARFADGDLLLFLNPDTWFTDDSLARAVRFFDARPDLGALGIHLLNEDGTTQKSCSYFPTPFRVFIDQFYLGRLLCEKLREKFSLPNRRYDVSGQVDWVMGAFVLVRKEDFGSVSGWPEDYYMYAEDMALCKALRDRGKPCYYLADASVVHTGGVSAAQRYGPKREARVIAAHRSFIKKHEPKKEKRLCRIYAAAHGCKALICRIAGKKERAGFYASCRLEWKKPLEEQ